MRRLLLFLLLVTAAQAQTATFSANLIDLGYDPVGTRTKVRLVLAGCGGNQPRVNGTGLIPPSGANVFSYEFTPDASGQISDSVIRNDYITCGDSTSSTFYNVSVCRDGICGPPSPYRLTSGAFNLNSATPITTAPVVTAPTGDTTYARLDGGNTPFTGSIQVKNMNNVRHAYQFSGANAGAQIAAAIADLPSTGGVVNADSYQGSQTVSSGGIQVGTSTKPVALKFGLGSTLNITATDGLDVFKVGDSSNVRCEPTTTAISHQGGRIVLGSSANIKSVFASADQTGAQESLNIDGCYVQGHASATISSALFDIASTYVPTTLRNVTGYICPNAACIQLRGSSLAGSSVLTVEDSWGNGGNVTGAKPCVVKSVGTTQPISDFRWVGGACEHAGDGVAHLTIDGSSVSGIAGVGRGLVERLYIETQGSNAGTGILIKDADSITINSVSAGGGAAVAPGGECMIRIEETSSGRTRNIHIEDVYANSDTYSCLVNDTRTGTKYTGDLLNGGYRLREFSIYADGSVCYRANSETCSTTVTGQQVLKAPADSQPALQVRSYSAVPVGDFAQFQSSTPNVFSRIDQIGAYHSNGSASGLYYGGVSGTEGSMSLQASQVQFLTSAGGAMPMYVGKLNVRSSFGSDSAPTNGIYSEGGVKIGSTGANILKHLSSTASLDFAAWSGTNCQTLTLTVTGAADGDSVYLGIPNALASTGDVVWSGWVSASNTVSVRGCKITAGASADPAAATVRADVWQH